MYKFCPNCGLKLSADAHFCPNCGYELKPTTESPIHSEAQPTQPTEQAAETTAPQSSQTDQSSQSTEAPQAEWSHHRATITPSAYNGSGNPGLIRSTKLWLKTAFHASQCMGRADYWWGYLGLAIIQFVISFIYDATQPTDAYYGSPSLMSVLLFIYTIFFTILNIFAIVQRLHDAGHSGYNWLWCLTGIGTIYVFILIIQPTNWGYTKFPRNDYQIK